MDIFNILFYAYESFVCISVWCLWSQKGMSDSLELEMVESLQGGVGNPGPLREQVFSAGEHLSSSYKTNVYNTK